MTNSRFGILPWRFKFAHRFSQDLHDRLIDIVHHLRNERFWEAKITFRSEADAEAFLSLPEGQAVQWLEEHEYGDVIGEILLKPFVVALIEDFVQFTYEALGASARGKPVVAYALLRKPLRDDLSQLEWLAADPEGFLNAFYNLKPGVFEPQTVQRQYVVPRIEKLLKLLPSSVSYDPECLFEMRFDKSAGWGFYQAWNRALHLVTSKLDSEPRSVNLVFAGEAARLEDWLRIYSLLPMTMFYAVEISELLVAYVAKELMPDWEVAQLKRGIGFVLWGVARRRMDGELPPRSEQMVDGLLKLPCPACDGLYQS
jgi:hypothetical protein